MIDNINKISNYYNNNDTNNKNNSQTIMVVQQPQQIKSQQQKINVNTNTINNNNHHENNNNTSNEHNYSKQNTKYFYISLIIIQIIIIICFGLFIRIQSHFDNLSISKYYPMFQDLNVMCIFGIGYLNSYIRTYSYMGIVHNFFFNCLSYQLFFLLSAFWKRFLVIGFNEENYYITFKQQDFTLASYSVSAANAAMAIIFGRVGFFQYLIMNIISILSYTLNSTILVNFIIVYDVGGSIFGFSFGTYFGIACSYIISKYKKPITKINHNYQTILFSFIGCFLLYAYSPSINAIYLTNTPFQRTLVIINTILGLCGSILSSYSMSVYLKGRFSVIDLFNGSLAGAIGVGSSTGLFWNPAACMIIGAVSGIICVLGMQYLTKYLENKFNLYDTFGVHNVKGLPGIFGGLMGAVGIALSETLPQDVKNKLQFFEDNKNRSVGQMVGYQILGTLCCVCMGLLFGSIAGLMINRFSKLKQQRFYLDSEYFSLPIQNQQYKKLQLR